MGGASWLPSNSEILRGPGILWILGQCPWEAALWGLWTVERAAHLGGCGSHSAEQSLSQAYKGGPGCGWSLFSALVTPLHTKGSHTNTARSWSFTALWPAGPLTHRVLQTPPQSQPSVLQGGDESPTPGALCSRMHKTGAPGPCMSVCIRLNLQRDTQHTRVHAYTVRMCLHVHTCTHSPPV